MGNVEELKIPIEGMSCGHCKATLEAGIGKVPGVGSVTVDLASKTARLTVSDAGVKAKVEAVIEDLGYEVGK